MNLLEVNTLSNCILLQTPLLKYQYQAVTCDVLLLFNILSFLKLPDKVWLYISNTAIPSFHVNSQKIFLLS